MYQHAPLSGGGHGAEGQLGPSRLADGLGVHGVHALGSIAQVQSARSSMAGPGPLHLVGRPWMRIALCLASRHGIRPASGGAQKISPMGQSHAGASGVWQNSGRRGYHRAIGPRIANGVGMAIAEMALAARFNRPGHQIVDHYTYVLVSDGDLEEGISSEAGSIAGHQHLGKLIVLYADNHITIEGSTELTFTEDRMARFAAFGWHVQRVEQSNDVDAVDLALQNAREESGRPSLIAVRTHIGFDSPHKQDTAAAHGEALGVEEVRLTKEGMNWPVEPAFHIPEEALEHFRKRLRAEVLRRRNGSRASKRSRNNTPTCSGVPESH